MAAVSVCRRWLPVLLLALAAIVVLFYRLGDARTFGSHETFVATPARAMLNGGDWIVPRYAEKARLEKPPLCYWAVAATAWYGGEVNEWTARLPAALSAALLAALIGQWALRWYGTVAAMGAVAAQLTSVYVVSFARKAEVDMMLCLLTTLALFLVADQRPAEPRRSARLRWTIVYALLGLSWLAKFHYGPVMVLAPTILYLLVERRYRSFLHLLNPVGLALMATAVFLWPFLVLHRFPDALQIWKTETVGRALGAMNSEPFWFYVPAMVWMTLPWTPWAVAALPASWKQAWGSFPLGRLAASLPTFRRCTQTGAAAADDANVGNARERFLWIWLLTDLGIVTASADKHEHYLLAALPVFSLFAGQRLAVLAKQTRPNAQSPDKFVAVLCTLVAVVVATVTPAFVIERHPQLNAIAWALAAIFAAGTCTIIWLRQFGKMKWAACTAFAGLLAIYLVVIGWIIPSSDHRLFAVHFARQVREMVPADTELAVYRMGRNPLPFYLDEPIRHIDSADALCAAVARDGRLMLVAFEYFLYEIWPAGRIRIVHHSVVGPKVPATDDAQLMLVELEFEQDTKSLTPKDDAANGN